MILQKTFFPTLVTTLAGLAQNIILILNSIKLRGFFTSTWLSSSQYFSTSFASFEQGRCYWKKICLFWACAETTLESNTKQDENFDIWQSNTKLVSAHNWWSTNLRAITTLPGGELYTLDDEDWEQVTFFYAVKSLEYNKAFIVEEKHLINYDDDTDTDT